MVRFHYITDAGYNGLHLACGAPQGAEYVTRNTRAITCDDCLFMVTADAVLDVNTDTLEQFYS